MTPCLCKDHSHNVAIVTTAFYDDPTPDAIAFVRENWQVDMLRLRRGSAQGRRSRTELGPCNGYMRRRQAP